MACSASRNRRRPTRPAPKGTSSPQSTPGLAEAVDVVRIIREGGGLLARQISTIGRSADGEYTLRLVDGDVVVRLGYPEAIRGRLAKLELFLDQVLLQQGPTRFASIDLRWQGQVVVRYREGREV